MYRLQRRSGILALALVVIVLDWATGPYIRFPIAFVLPVYSMGWQYGRWPGIWLAYAMLAIRLAYSFYWDNAIPHWLLYEALNTVIRAAVLTLIASLADQVRKREEKLQREIVKLEGILPICGYCKKIRNEENEWEQMEEYITRHSEAEFSHSICPDCMQLHYGDLLKRRQQKANEQK